MRLKITPQPTLSIGFVWVQKCPCSLTQLNEPFQNVEFLQAMSLAEG
jgi:hypothetical protein